eukprot:365328-Chlamydomonas_euryale.AAC.8
MFGNEAGLSAGLLLVALSVWPLDMAAPQSLAAEWYDGGFNSISKTNARQTGDVDSGQLGIKTLRWGELGCAYIATVSNNADVISVEALRLRHTGS